MEQEKMTFCNNEIDNEEKLNIEKIIRFWRKKLGNIKGVKNIKHPDGFYYKDKKILKSENENEFWSLAFILFNADLTYDDLKEIIFKSPKTNNIILFEINKRTLTQSISDLDILNEISIEKKKKAVLTEFKLKNKWSLRKWYLWLDETICNTGFIVDNYKWFFNDFILYLNNALYIQEILNIS